MMLILVVTWPLSLALGVAFSATRPLALRLAPWAALPALATAGLLANGSAPLPGILIDGALILDDTGRLFLLLSAILWLASGLLVRADLRTAKGRCFAVLLLMAMAGGFAMSLAADGLSFYAATTVAGYTLCGLLVCDAGFAARQAGRVLIVLLVASDLVVFELLLILGLAAGSVDFMALRQAFQGSDNQALLLALLVVGFGIKLGVAGVHFWLAPVFTTAFPALRPALISFMLGAGLLGWLRLMPLGEVQWVAAGSVLQWLAWITLGYAVIAGLLQTQVRSTLAYVAVALSALWLMLLGAALVSPQAWNELREAMMASILQSGMALTALLLLERYAADGDPAGSPTLRLSLMWLAIWVLAAAPVSVMEVLRNVDGLATWPLHGVTVVTALLAVRSVMLAAAVSRDAHALSPASTATHRRARVSMGTTLPVAGGLMVVALLATAFSLVGRSSSGFWMISTLMMSIAALVAWLSFRHFALFLPVLPPGDLLAPISNLLSVAVEHGRRLGNQRLPQWRDAGLARARRLGSGGNGWRLLAQIEVELHHWRTVMLVLVLLGLTLACCGSVG